MNAPRLQTARLILRDWSAADAPDLIEGLNDLNVSRWLAHVPHPYTTAAAEQWVELCRLAAERRERTDFDFALQRKEDGKVIGGVSLRAVNRVQGTATGGIWLNARFHRQGYGAEAWAEKIRFAFEELGLRRLENGFFLGNEASGKLMQRFGYQREGLRRQAYRSLADGELKDECVCGLLRQEWIRPKAPLVAG